MANFDSGVLWDDPSVRYDEFVEPPTPPMSQNKVSAVLATTAVTNINTALATIRTNLPFLINLTPQERHDLAHAASGGQGVLLDSLTFAAQHPEALPATFNAAEFAKDGALLTPFAPVAAAVAQLNEDVSDTMIALQSDLYAEFLDVYAFAKANNRNGAYDAYVNAVKGRFAKGPRQPKPVPPPGA